MPLKKGHSPEVIRQNVREMVAAGHDPKQAVAAALSTARKYKKMWYGGMYSEGGEVSVDEDDDASSYNSEQAENSLGAIRDMGEYHPESVASPESQDHQRDLAKALWDKQESYEMMSEGGLVEGMDGDEMPDEHMASDTDEPMSDMPEKPAPLEHTMSGLSEQARMALQAKKKQRRFAQG